MKEISQVGVVALTDKEDRCFAFFEVIRETSTGTLRKWDVKRAREKEKRGGSEEWREIGVRAAAGKFECLGSQCSN
jgi:hypothetical protein